MAEGHLIFQGLNYVYVCCQFEFFTNAKKWQYWHYCQLYIPMYLQIRSLFASHDISDISECEIRCQ